MRRSYRAATVLAALLAWLLAASCRAAGGELAVYFLDVGQGDAQCIHTPAGQDILIDGGPPEAGPVLVEQLRAQGVTSLDLVVISHPHADHMGGLAAMLQAFPVSTVWDSGQPTTSRTFLRLLQELEKQRSARLELARPGMTRELGGGVTLEALAPREPLLQDTHSDPNNNSVVLRLTYGAVRFLFTGDVESDGVAQLLAGQRDRLAAKVLKVPHHGSRFTTPDEFLDAVRPEVAIVSSGRGNSYGHPHAEALARLRQHGVQIWRTDEQGTIRVSTDGSTYRVTNLPPPAAWAARLHGHAPADPDASPPPRVNVNTATLQELIDLPEIGAALARRIIAGRPYRSLDDLRRVKGLKTRLERLRDRLTVE